MIRLWYTEPDHFLCRSLEQDETDRGPGSFIITKRTKKGGRPVANRNNGDPYRRGTEWNGMNRAASGPARGYTPQGSRGQVPPGSYQGQDPRQTPAGYGVVPDPRQQYNRGMMSGNRTSRPLKKQKKGSTALIAAVLIILLAVIGAGAFQSASQRKR